MRDSASLGEPQCRPCAASEPLNKLHSLVAWDPRQLAAVEASKGRGQGRLRWHPTGKKRACSPGEPQGHVDATPEHRTRGADRRPALPTRPCPPAAARAEVASALAGWRSHAWALYCQGLHVCRSVHENRKGRGSTVGCSGAQEQPLLPCTGGAAPLGVLPYSAYVGLPNPSQIRGQHPQIQQRKRT